MSFVMCIRRLRADEHHVLDEFLYLAIHVSPGEPAPPREVTRTPELAIYVQDFGRHGDRALVAEVDDTVIGAVWSRLFSAQEPAYGTVDAETPNLALSVLPEYRGRGVGTALLTRHCRVLRESGFRRVSLSVQPDNPARRLYERCGFTIHRCDHAECVMAKNLTVPE